MISIIMPLEEDRVDLFEKSIEVYVKQITKNVPIEFIIPTRTLKSIYVEGVPTVTVPYEWNEDTFNPAMALNLGVSHANYDTVIITSPEVMPITDVLSQLVDEIGNNVICQVFDQEEDGTTGMSLVNSNFRSNHPSMYFLAMFNKKDIETINGWDEDFMKAYGYEDDDFGCRFTRAGLTFKVRDDIQALHQWHHRPHSQEGVQKGSQLLYQNSADGVIRPKNGMVKK